MPNSHEDIIEAARRYVQAEMPEDYTGHDFLHVERVWKLAKRIAHECGVMIALLRQLSKETEIQFDPEEVRP